MPTSATPASTLDVFISYAREDRDTASHLAAVLQARGISVWWDREILGGSEFSEVIEQELQRARLALVLWSEEAVQSSFVRDESARALAAGKLLPVLIEDVSPPLGFGQLHTLALLDWDGEDDAPALIELIAHIERRLKGGVGPPLAGVLGGRVLRLKRRTLIAGGAVAAAVAAAWFGGSVWFGRDTERAQQLTADGVEKFELKQFALARIQFNQALEADGQYAPALFFRAQVLVQSGAPQEAVDDLKRVLDLKRGLDNAQLRDARRWLAELVAQPAEPAPVARDGGATPVPDSPPAPAAPPPVAAAPAPPRPPIVAGQPSQAGARPQATFNSNVKQLPGSMARPAPKPPVVVTVEAQAAAAAAEVRSLPLTGAALDKLTAAVETMFSPSKDARIAATTSLIIDPEVTSDAVPVSVRRALMAQRNGVPKDPAELSGVINVLVVLQAATPGTLDLHAADIRSLLEKARGNGPQTAELVTSVAALLAQAEKHSPLVYLQIASDAQRTLAAALTARLRRAGYRVPAAEVVGARAPARTEIRIHGRSDRSLARWMAKLGQELIAAPVTVQTLRNVKPKNDTFEIWFDANLCTAPERKPAACGA